MDEVEQTEAIEAKNEDKINYALIFKHTNQQQVYVPVSAEVDVISGAELRVPVAIKIEVLSHAVWNFVV